MQRAAAGGPPAVAPPIVHDVLRSPGAPLDGPTRAAMQSRLGAGLGDVRVHTDEFAATSARAVGALAYTVGSSVVFDRGRYAPERPEGRTLLAHELAHTIQQGGGGPPPSAGSLRVEPPDTALERAAHEIARDVAPEPSSVGDDPPSAIRRQATAPPTLQRQAGAGAGAGAATQAFSADRCDPNHAIRPCQSSRCTPAQRTAIAADLARAQRYVATALQAIGAGGASALLEWHFNSTSPATVGAVQARLQCIAQVLASAAGSVQWGCDPDDAKASAYVCVQRPPPNPAACNPVTSNLCFTSLHFGRSDADRSRTVIHESGHRIGLSTGPGTDTYSRLARFRYLSTAEALANTDSFAQFVVDVATGATMSLVARAPFGGTFGAAIPTQGQVGWIAQLSFFDLEFQRPVLDIIQPSVGLQLTLIGERGGGPETPLAQRSPLSVAPEIITGLRLGDARPGSSGGAFAQVTGSAGAVVAGRPGGSRPEIGFTGSVGVSAGYRWRWLEAGGGIGYRYDQTGERIGAQHLIVPHAFVNITLTGLQ